MLAIQSILPRHQLRFNSHSNGANSGHVPSPLSPSSSTCHLAASTSASTQAITSPTTITSAPRNTINTPTAGVMSQQSAAARRPKLSLKTTDAPRACGRSTTGLAFASSIVSAATSGGRICLTPTSATASPTTARNTFSNAYTISGTPTSATAMLSPARYTAAAAAAAAGLPHLHSPLSTRSKLPYQQPLHVRSILRNSPLPAQHRRRITSSSTSSPLFPKVKRVRYADPLAGEIRTKVYVKSHFEQFVGEVEDREVVGKRRRRMRRRREWAWTLGPLSVSDIEGGKKRAREPEEEEEEDEDEDEHTMKAEPSDEDEDSGEAISPPQPNLSEHHPNKRLKSYSPPSPRKRNIRENPPLTSSPYSSSPSSSSSSSSPSSSLADEKAKEDGLR